MNALTETLNHAAETWWVQVFHATWQSSALCLALLVLVHLGRRWAGQLRYAVLLLALLKFAVPGTLSAPTGVFGWIGPTVSTETEAHRAREGLSDPADHPAALCWRTRAMLAHAGGALALAGWVAIQMGRIARMARRSRRVGSGELYEQWKDLLRRMSITREVRLLVSPSPGTPVAFGIVRPSVIVPQSVIDDDAPGKIATILAHELGHHRRRDLWVNWVQIVLGAIWWFNPLIWVLNRMIRSTREDCCDDLLLARKLTSPAEYCSSLLAAARNIPRTRLLGWAPGFAEPLHPLAGRIRRIMDPRRRPSRLSLKNRLLIAAMTALLLPGLHSVSSAVPEEVPPSMHSQGHATAQTEDMQADLPSQGPPILEAASPKTPKGADTTRHQIAVRHSPTPYRIASPLPRARGDHRTPAREFQSADLGFDTGPPRRPRRITGPQLAAETSPDPVIVTRLDERRTKPRSGRTAAGPGVEDAFLLTLSGLGIPPVDSGPLEQLVPFASNPEATVEGLYAFRSHFGLGSCEQGAGFALIDADRPKGKADPTDIPLTETFDLLIIVPPPPDDQGAPQVWPFDPSEQGPSEQAPTDIMVTVQGFPGAPDDGMDIITDAISLLDGPFPGSELPGGIHFDGFPPVDPGVFTQTSTLVPDPLTIVPLLIGVVLLASRRRGGARASRRS